MKVEIRRIYKNGKTDSIEIHEGMNVSVYEDDGYWYVTFEDGDRKRWIPKGKQWIVNVL